MEREYIIYAAYLLVFLLIFGFMIGIPLLAFNSDMTSAYGAIHAANICHQKLSRSLCIFTDGKGYWIGDCTPQTGEFITNPLDWSTIKVENDGVVGYKMAVCARDFGIYGAMLLGGLVYPFVRNIRDRRVPPAIYLVAALVPIGIDGTLQLVSEIGLLPFIYESTNLIRLLTGGIAGFAAAFYTIALLVNLFTEMKEAPEKHTKK